MSLSPRRPKLSLPLGEISPRKGLSPRKVYGGHDRGSEYGSSGFCSPVSTRSPSPGNGLPPEISTGYEFHKIIGSGKYAVVRHATRQVDGQEVAVKCVESDEHDEKSPVREEYNLLSTLNHPSIVRVHALHDTPSGIWLCMEFCNGGKLTSYLRAHGPIQENRARILVLQLFEGVDYLHRKRIVHRDIKANNLLVMNSGEAPSVLKIVDFMSARQIGIGSEGPMLTHRGCREYRAPELEFGLDWNERVDIWAGGMCSFFMLRTKLPFNIQRREVKEELLKGRLPDVTWDGISEMMCNFIRQCLTIEMRDRPPAMALLVHPVFAISSVNDQISRGRRVYESRDDTELFNQFRERENSNFVNSQFRENTNCERISPPRLRRSVSINVPSDGATSFDMRHVTQVKEMSVYAGE